jgi:hypothetical protein
MVCVFLGGETWVGRGGLQPCPLWEVTIRSEFAVPSARADCRRPKLEIESVLAFFSPMAVRQFTMSTWSNAAVNSVVPVQETSG